MAKQAQTLTRDAIQYETKRDFSTSPHSKQKNTAQLDELSKTRIPAY